MTTIAQVRQVVQPLLQRHSDLALVGRYLVLKPVHHFERGVFIGQGISPRHFVPSVSVGLMFGGQIALGAGWGDRLNYFCFEGLDADLADIKKNDSRFGDWAIDRPENIEIMLRGIEAVFRYLRPMTTLEQMVAFASRYENNLTPFEFLYYPRLLMAVATGDLDTATQIIEGPDYRQDELLRAINARFPTFYPALVARDRQELAKFLHEREAKTVKNLKFEKIWERTPFPLEL